MNDQDFLKAKPLSYFTLPPFDQLIFFEEKNENLPSQLPKITEFNDELLEKKRKIKGEIHKNLDMAPIDQGHDFEGYIPEKIDISKLKNQKIEERKEKGETITPLAVIDYPTINNHMQNLSQPQCNPEKLNHYLGELSLISKNMERDFSVNKAQIEADPQIGFYYNALFNYSFSLTQLIQQMSVVSSQTPFLYQPQMIFQPQIGESLRSALMNPYTQHPEPQ